MRRHVEALFTHDVNGDLVRVNEPDGAPAPRFFVGGTAHGMVLRFRHDVDRALRLELEAACEKDAGHEHDLQSPALRSRCEEILARSAAIQKTWSGPAFTFPEELATPAGTVLVTAENEQVLHSLLGAWVVDVRQSQPLFASIVDGYAVSVCGSVRRTAEAHEAGVETAPSYRGRGHAVRVVAAWAGAVRTMGRAPLYSTSWQNEASRAVARKLSLFHFGSDLHFT